MTGALRSLADEKLRKLLALTVDSPSKGAITGALSTAVLQSSSATTVAAVGFVGAGLLTFPESLGVIFGANIGTTLTGWLVALLGLKLSLGQMLLPLILVGVLLQMTGRNRLEQIGLAVSGFGLIFVGIGVLQEGMSGFQGWVTPEHFPPDTMLGRMLLVFIGIVITLITQSSSAGVTTALVAVHADAISLNQAAAMVIGMDVGTTATAAFATIGGNVNARRTGFAHVIYNTLTGLGAFVLLSPYMTLVETLLPGARLTDPELVLVGFHTFFNIIGVLVVLPFTHQFANMIIRLIPEHGNPLTKQLDHSLLTNPTIALAAVRDTLAEVTNTLLGELRCRLRDPATAPDLRHMNNVTDAIKQVGSYLQEISTRFQSSPPVQDYLAYLHVLDHLRRIDIRVRNEKRFRLCRVDAELSAMSEKLLSAIEQLSETESPIPTQRAGIIHSISVSLKTTMKEYRSHVVEETSKGRLSTAKAIRRMDTARSLRRIGYHIWRISYHLSKPDADQPSTESVREAPGTTTESTD